MDVRPRVPRETPLLVTALRPPRLPPAHVRRPRLLERLDAGAAGPVTLICGPPGAGKTTLLCSWLQERAGETRVAWVSLDAGRNDPERLWEAVLAGLCGRWGEESFSPLVGRSGTAFLRRLINEFAELPEPTVLVLDDVHVLRSRDCLAQLAFLLTHLPATLRIVLSGREKPAVPLHGLRVLGTLMEIRSGDLAFTDDEAAELLRAHGLALDPGLVATLRARTEGWAAGLRLAALGLQRGEAPARFITEFGGDDRVVGDYLLAEVLDREPARRRAFLLRTSIADRLSGELADAITGERTGGETLAELERTNGFVVGIDPRGEWYRYHVLFARLLEIRAQLELGDELRTLHLRAARWHAAAGETWPALRHSIAAEDWELAARLTVDHGVELLAGGQGSALGALVAELPREWVERDPELSAIVACGLIESGAAQPHFEALALDAPDADADPRGPAESPVETVAHRTPDVAADPRALAESRALARLYRARLRGDAHDALTAADELLAGADPRDGSRRALVHASLGRTALWAGDVDRAARELEAAVAIGRARGLDHLLVSALGQLALLNVSRHGPDLARPLTEEALQLAQRRGWADSPETAAAQLAAAATALYAHRLDAAGEHVQAGRAALQRSHDVHLAAVARHLGALVAEARGDIQQGLEGLGAAVGDVPGWGLADPGMLLATQARLLLASGDGFEAKRALHRAPSAPGGALQAGFARIHLAEGDAYAALATLSEARPELAVTRVDLLLLESLAFERLGRADVGTAFEATLTAAESTGVKAPLAQAGAAIRPRLLEAIRHGTAHRAVVGELLDVLDERLPLEPAPATIDPLSGREQAVLRYLPTTLSNREIAVELLVSTNTLKTHLRAIYRKLDVGDRRDAVRRARSLGLLAGHRIAG